jgi:hypothetical protein
MLIVLAATCGNAMLCGQEVKKVFLLATNLKVANAKLNMRLKETSHQKSRARRAIGSASNVATGISRHAHIAICENVVLRVRSGCAQPARISIISTARIAICGSAELHDH